MQLRFERFETRIVEDLLEKNIVILIFEPNDIQVINMHDYTGINKNHFEIVFDYKKSKILNESAKIHFEVDSSYLPIQKLSLKEMLEKSDVMNCIREAVFQKYFGHYSYSDEAIGLFREMEQLNKERLINKALETGDKELFMKLTKGVV